MVQQGISLYINDDWYFTQAKIQIKMKQNLKIYQNGILKIYDSTTNSWKVVGAAGTNMINLYTVDDEEFIESNNKEFLVRQQTNPISSLL